MSVPADSLGKDDAHSLRLSNRETETSELMLVGHKALLDYKIAHEMPGRLRIKLEALKREPNKISSCLMQLSDAPGVVSVGTNFWSGSAVIYYDQNQLSSKDVLSLIGELTWPDGQAHSPLPSKPSFLISVCQKILSVLDRTLPAVIQVGLGSAAFAAAVLEFPSLIQKGLLIASIAPIASRALHTIVEEKKLGVDALDGMAAGMMLANGKIVEAAFMTGLISLGEYIRERTAKRCEKIVSDLLGMSGRFAWIVKGNKRVCVPADEVKVGDIVAVYPGDMIPVDGVVLSGEAAIDQSKLTGESIPVEVVKGDKVLAATVAVEGKIHMRCEATGSDTRAGMVLESMAGAPLHETKIQNYASVVADKLVVPIFISAGLCYALTKNYVRMMSMLIFDFSTGIRIAAPTAVLASMHRAGRRGILIKSGGALERLSEIDAIVFDKTGTLTSGEPKVTRIVEFNGHSGDKILALAAAVEQRLHHPASRAIVKHAHHKNLAVPDRASSTFMRGMGVKAQVDEHVVIVGSKRLMDTEGISTTLAKPDEASIIKSGESLAYVAVDGALAGLIAYSDLVRPEVASVMKQLKRLGIRKLVMATGDGETAASVVAAAAGIDEVIARAFPEHKAELVLKLKEQGYKVAVIGDGINDSPALAHADCAISLHGGTEAARHSANVVLTDDDLRRLPEAIKIARSAMDLVRQNLSLAVVPNSAGLALAGFGLVGPAGATFLNNGSAIVAALNSLRPLYVNSWSTDSHPIQQQQQQSDH